jgi:hypothetical protein
LVAYKTVEFLVQGLFGMGFTFAVLSYVVQRYEDVLIPVLVGQGASELAMQMFDAVNYAVELMLPIGLIAMLLAVVIWAANWA